MGSARVDFDSEAAGLARVQVDVLLDVVVSGRAGGATAVVGRVARQLLRDLLFDRHTDICPHTDLR